MAAFIDREAKSAPERKSGPQGRHWCWTLNVTEDPGPVATAFAALLADKRHRFSVWQMERAPTTGQLHYQGYSELAAPVKLGGMKKLLPGAHLELRKGKREVARDYCKKPDTQVHPPEEHGDWGKGGTGARNDIRALYEDIKKGEGVENLMENHTAAYFKYHKAVDKVSSVLSHKRKRELVPPQCLVFWGPTGTGKTRKCYEEAPELFSLVTNSSQKQVWWDGYDAHETILFDDFYGGILPGELLKYLDRYPVRLAVKGGFTDKDWKKVYITSNRPPWMWYKDQKHWPALERRLTEFGSITYVGGDNEALFTGPLLGEAHPLLLSPSPRDLILIGRYMS